MGWEWKLTYPSAFDSLTQIWAYFIAYRRDTFVYEYVGDVVNPASFKRRMREYAEEGIQHFYFMMLQKDEVGLIPGFEHFS